MDSSVTGMLGSSNRGAKKLEGGARPRQSINDPRLVDRRLWVAHAHGKADELTLITRSRQVPYRPITIAGEGGKTGTNNIRKLPYHTIPYYTDRWVQKIHIQVQESSKITYCFHGPASVAK